MAARCGALLLVLVAGCVSSVSKPEPPPAAHFRLGGVSERAPLLHGTTRSYALTLDRDAEFTSVVTLAVTVDPSDQGVTARVEPGTLDLTVASAKLLVNVSEFARPGEYTLHVVGRADGSPDATSDVRVTVPPKD